jgi:hypothetical protein
MAGKGGIFFLQSLWLGEVSMGMGTNSDYQSWLKDYFKLKRYTEQMKKEAFGGSLI